MKRCHRRDNDLAWAPNHACLRHDMMPCGRWSLTWTWSHDFERLKGDFERETSEFQYEAFKKDLMGLPSTRQRQRCSLGAKSCLLKTWYDALWSLVVDMNIMILSVCHDRTWIVLAQDCYDALWSLVVDMNILRKVVKRLSSNMKLSKKTLKGLPSTWQRQRCSMDTKSCSLNTCHDALWSLVVDMNVMIRASERTWNV